MSMRPSYCQKPRGGVIGDMRVPGVQVGTRGRRRRDPRCLPTPRPDPACTKRRIQEEDEGPAVKLYLSEDTVSARLQRLSLENDHSYGGNGFPKVSPLQEPQSLETGSPDSDPEEEDVLVDPGEFCMSSSQVLVVCPVLEESLRDTRPGSIVPESLLRSLSSPCLELVVWSPPTSPIHQLLRSLAGLQDSPSVPCCEKEPDEGMEL
ncbi:host cell factor C1 regulator 1 [Mixophyes fleayi]|uniref:host cell factor C1 regulator 1 n=1 Tax=Mixophyes fleayi TaxID=3061075 RepID=UPI003F4DED82